MLNNHFTIQMESRNKPHKEFNHDFKTIQASEYDSSNQKERLVQHTLTPTQSPDSELRQQMEGHSILPESEVIIKGPRLRAYSQEHGASELNQTLPVKHQLDTIESKNALQRSQKNETHAYSQMSSSLNN